MAGVASGRLLNVLGVEFGGGSEDGKSGDRDIEVAREDVDLWQCR